MVTDIDRDKMVKGLADHCLMFKKDPFELVGMRYPGPEKHVITADDAKEILDKLVDTKR